MSEMNGYMQYLKSMREQAADVNDAVALDTAVQAVALLDRILSSEPLRDAVEQHLGEDAWPA